MQFKDVIEAHKKWMATRYNKVYEDLISPIRHPWNWNENELDNIIEFVRRWTSHVPIGRNKNKIKKVVQSLREDFEKLADQNLENVDFNTENVKIIGNIFYRLSSCPLKFTGSSKLMHGINPHLFIMWDVGIRNKYVCYHNSAGYIKFMRLMQDELSEVMNDHAKAEITRLTGRSLPKLIDEYNWWHFRTSKIRSVDK